MAALEIGAAEHRKLTRLCGLELDSQAHSCPARVVARLPRGFTIYTARNCHLSPPLTPFQTTTTHTTKYMLSAHPSSIHFNLDDDDEWMPTTTTHPARLFRTSSISSWGVTSFGRGYDWHSEGSTPKASEKEAGRAEEAEAEPQDELPALTQPQPLQKTPIMTSSPAPSLAIPPDSVQPKSTRGSAPSSPRPRRRSSQQRVSLIAGRVSIAPIDPAESLLPPQGLRRTASSGSTLSTAVSTRAPSPCSDQQSFLGERNISEFVIEGEIGRGAYGLVKRAREKRDDGAAGVSLSPHRLVLR